MSNDRLLEDLAEMCGCYISTLKSYPLNQLMQYCSKLDLNNYNLEEWNYCFSYILETKTKFLSYEDLKNFLKSHEE